MERELWQAAFPVLNLEMGIRDSEGRVIGLRGVGSRKVGIHSQVFRQAALLMKHSKMPRKEALRESWRIVKAGGLGYLWAPWILGTGGEFVGSLDPVSEDAQVEVRRSEASGK
jgi:hypothetical protein